MPEHGSIHARSSLKLELTFPFGSVALFAALGSLAACYGIIFLQAAFGLADWSNQPHVQGALMWILAAVAAVALWLDRRRHGRLLPAVVGTVGTAILIITLYLSYDVRVEVLAYVFLLIGALLNQIAMIASLHTTTSRQASQIAALNQTLADRVAEQSGEIERLSLLRAFLSPQVAELVVSRSDQLLHSHRRSIACLFCDVRNFTAMAEALEPEETMNILRSFHDTAGELIGRHEGTIGYRAGDGFMVFFNDPVPCERPGLAATQLALALRAGTQPIWSRWQEFGHPVGAGIGIASGYATLGLVGQQGRADYSAVGPVVNLAARLCQEAGNGEIIVDARTHREVEGELPFADRKLLSLKGVSNPTEAWLVQ